MKRRMAQPLFVLSVAVTLVLMLSVVALSAQFQPIVPDIGFEVEGNTALDQGGDFDWENAIPPAVSILDPNSRIETDPTVFKPNSKFEDPAGWSIMPARVGPGQSELVNFLVWEIQPGDLDDGRPVDHWLVLGMERIKVPGFFEMDFEYNQLAWDGSSGGLTRASGDVLVGFELRGKPTSKKAAFKVLLLQYLPGAQPSLCRTKLGPGGEPESVDVGTQPCPPYGDSGWYYRLLADDVLTADSGLVQATMNTEPILVPLATVAGNDTPFDVISPYEFAEAAINLTALGIEPDCADPGTVHAKSRSAPHVHSDLKDLVGPVRLTECVPARLDGHKFLDVDGDGLWGQDEPSLQGWEIRLSDGSVTHTDAEGFYAFEGLAYGAYTVSEVCPAGWAQTAPGLTDFDTCGSKVHTVELCSGTPEANGLDFGNGQPLLSLAKTCEAVFGGIEYSITVANEGNVLLQDILVEDTDTGFSEIIDELAPGDSRTLEGLAPGDYLENTATATAEYAGATISASATAECIPTYPVLWVAKDAQTSFTRTYQWTLDKTVEDPGPIFLYPGDYTVAQYEVVAGLDDPAYVDSDWMVEGTITIENGGDAPIPLASVTDVITPGDISVPVECDDWIVPTLGSVTCTYGPVSLPDGSARTNTVMVTVQGSAEEWTATTDVVFDQPTTEIDAEADVEDSNWGYLDRLRYDEAPRIYMYPERIRAPREVCGLFEVPNTATLVTNDTNTTLTAYANVQIFEACPTLAYEDLPLILQNDWDYNDLVVEVPIYLDVSDDGDLLAASFEILEQGRLTAFTHAFNLQPYAEYFVCSGTYTKRTTVGGVVTTETGAYTPGDNFLLIPDTGVPADLVELRIDFDVATPGDCPRDFGSPDPIGQYHGEWLFFDPWLTVYPREDIGLDPYEIHVIQEPPEPRILTVPVAWDPPPEKVPIWDVYPCVQAGNPPVFKPYWWDTAICME